MIPHLITNFGRALLCATHGPTWRSWRLWDRSFASLGNVMILNGTPFSSPVGSAAFCVSFFFWAPIVCRRMSADCSARWCGSIPLLSLAPFHFFHLQHSGGRTLRSVSSTTSNLIYQVKVLPISFIRPKFKLGPWNIHQPIDEYFSSINKSLPIFNWDKCTKIDNLISWHHSPWNNVFH